MPPQRYQSLTKIQKHEIGIHMLLCTKRNPNYSYSMNRYHKFKSLNLGRAHVACYFSLFVALPCHGVKRVFALGFQGDLLPVGRQPELWLLALPLFRDLRDQALQTHSLCCHNLAECPRSYSMALSWELGPRRMKHTSRVEDVTEKLLLCSSLRCCSTN